MKAAALAQSDPAAVAARAGLQRASSILRGDIAATMGLSPSPKKAGPRPAKKARDEDDEDGDEDDDGGEDEDEEEEEEQDEDEGENEEEEEDNNADRQYLSPAAAPVYDGFGQLVVPGSFGFPSSFASGSGRGMGGKGLGGGKGLSTGGRAPRKMPYFQSKAMFGGGAVAGISASPHAGAFGSTMSTTLVAEMAPNPHSAYWLSRNRLFTAIEAIIKMTKVTNTCTHMNMHTPHTHACSPSCLQCTINQHVFRSDLNKIPIKKSTDDATTDAPITPSSPSSRPLCKYGLGCYRKNPGYTCALYVCACCVHVMSCHVM